MLLTAVALSGTLGACAQIDNLFYGAREGTVEYPGSGAGANATTTYIVKDKDTVDGISQRFGLSTQTVIDRNKLSPPYALRSGQALELPGARPEAAPLENTTRDATGRQEVTVKREGLPPPPQQGGWGGPPRSGAPKQIEGEILARSSAVSGFLKGARVFHSKFGPGSVAQVDGTKLTVDFDKAGRKMVLESFVSGA